MRLEAVSPTLDVPLGSVPTNLAAGRNDVALARLRRPLRGTAVYFLPSMIDRAAIQHVDHFAPEHVQLERQLWTAFDAEPLEDGVTHPAEQIIEGFVRNARDAPDRLAELALDDASPAFAASVLRCLSRVAGVGSANWRANLVRDALGSRETQMRDAALQAAEEWGDPSLRPILRSHVSREPVTWLRVAAQDVIEEMV